MSGLSINFNEVKPEDIQRYIDAINKYAALLKILNIKQLSAVVDFVLIVSNKPFVPKLIAILLEIYNESWAQDVKTMVDEIKG